MTQGGGFCELHGPFDPPNEVCPYCSLEDQQRRVYGPPPGARPVSPSSPAPVPTAAPPVAQGDEFVLRTVEPPARLDVTEIAPRPAAVSAEKGEAAPSEGGPVPLPVGWLVVKEPRAQRGEVLRIEPNQSIGREADVRWNDPRLSRQHARFTLEVPRTDPASPPVFHIWPFGPTNPVYINGQEVRGATPLRENDEIRLGDTLFVFKVLTD